MPQLLSPPAGRHDGMMPRRQANTLMAVVRTFSVLEVIFLCLLSLVDAIISMTSDAPRPLRVMTLNIAHGRKDRFHQVFTFTSTIRMHLDEIAEVIGRENPDVVALQEADGPCWWSGGFDHVQYIADKAGMRYTFRGTHMQLFSLNYGTAIISKLPLKKNESIPFPSSWPTPPKGFVVVQVEWNELEVDVVSLHLDFLRSSVQREQVGMIVDTLSKRKRPMIVMGDFNCDWDTNSPLRVLCQQLGLQAFRPKDIEGWRTFGNAYRLDWILISANEEDFSAYTTLPDVVSDHLAVLSEVQLNKEAR